MHSPHYSPKKNAAPDFHNSTIFSSFHPIRILLEDQIPGSIIKLEKMPSFDRVISILKQISGPFAILAFHHRRAGVFLFGNFFAANTHTNTTTLTAYDAALRSAVTGDRRRHLSEV